MKELKLRKIYPLPKERDAPPSRSQINYAPLAVSIRSAAAFPLRMESSIEK